MVALIFHCSALDLLRDLPAECITAVVTDPPYNHLDKHRARGTTTRLTKRWFPTLTPDEVIAVISECYRVLKPKTHCYVMCNYEAVWEFKALIEKKTGFDVAKALVWDKVSIGMGYNYRSQHEFILFCKKGKRPVNNRGIGDVLRFKRIHPSHANYPTEKPVELLRVLIEQSTDKGDVVLDPFTGSGSTGEAALSCGRKFLGCDVSGEAVAFSRGRLGVVI